MTNALAWYYWSGAVKIADRNEVNAMKGTKWLKLNEIFGGAVQLVANER